MFFLSQEYRTQSAAPAAPSASLWQVPKFSGQKIHSTVIFNPVEQSSVVLEDEEDSELKGPVIDRRCSRCNKEGMVYHTRQMRSADEGQTVFFTCIHCRYQEKEDS
ncbi:DNA-directed RNA polymerase I subunit RPA12 isoform X2 [Seriola dumerili]|uniref:DNA-directed RNA polymerase I subunit RPA12 isoform X2 n=1 Tax=Seriola dumerili TaxID=41447 RepID=UPI000BBE4DB3|nr:DNA-directed RNA polymerase I subunit RPA12 isoform X2 [Seriola dumerili]